MARPYARTNAEAHMYMDLHPCPCGENEFERRSAVVNEQGVLCSRYAGACPRCGTARMFLCEIPEAIRPVVADHIEYGGDDPSRIIDAGEWMMIARVHLRPELAPQTRRELAIAHAALKEVKKFLPSGWGQPLDEGVPDDAFWTARGRAVRDADPDRFSQFSIATTLHMVESISEGAPVKPAAPRSRPPYLPPDPEPAAGSIGAQIEALAAAIATQHGFEGEHHRRHAAELVGYLQAVVRRSEVKARENQARLQTTSEAERILDSIVQSGLPAGAQIAAQRARISAALANVDLQGLGRSLQVVVDWLHHPDETRPIEALIGDIERMVQGPPRPPRSRSARSPPTRRAPGTRSRTCSPARARGASRRRDGYTVGR
jgi:hypothetical protein